MTDPRKITIQVRNVFGNDTVYPVDQAAKEFASIAGTKTLTRDSLASILRLGFVIVELDRYGQPCREHVAGSGRELCQLGRAA